MVASVLFLLIGCGQEDNNAAFATNHGFGWHYDVVGPDAGMRIRFHPQYTSASVQQIEAIYLATQACTGIVAPPPLVVISPPPIYPENPQYLGLCYFDTGLVVIDGRYSNDQHLFYEYKEEFVHHLLHAAGMHPDANRAHQSPLFSTCTQP